MKKALISGITGQDGSYLAELLLQKGYEVHGILRRSSSFNTGRIEHLYFDEWVRDMKQKRTINLHYGDMTDSSSLIRIIQQVQPDETQEAPERACRAGSADSDLPAGAPRRRPRTAALRAPGELRYSGGGMPALVRRPRVRAGVFLQGNARAGS